jgi:hypothetical protein
MFHPPDGKTGFVTTLERSLTWDRELEMAKHKDFTVATDVQVYFCEPQDLGNTGTRNSLPLLAFRGKIGVC